MVQFKPNIVDLDKFKPALSCLFKNRSSEYLVDPEDVKKFNTVWSFIDKFDLEEDFRKFLSKEGDCKNFKFIFAAVFFNCHTNESIDFINQSISKNSNLQDRHPCKFAFDLLFGWILEYFIFNKFGSKFGVKKSGCDYDYSFQKGRNINSSADFVLGTRLIELSVDNWGCSLPRKNAFHLRWKKWPKILEEDMYLFILCPNHSKYHFYHCSSYAEALDVSYIKRIHSFSKGKEDVDGYLFKGWNKLPARDLTPDNISKSFNDLLNARI